MTIELAQQIIEASLSPNEESLIQPFELGSQEENELLFFFKPECLLVPTADHRRAIVRMVLAKLEAFGTKAVGALLLRGKKLQQLGAMDRHYGYINRMSRTASQLLTQEDVGEVHQRLELRAGSDVPILGGHEALDRFPRIDALALNDLWLSEPSTKLRSGFYFRACTVDGERVILVNGYHPAQLSYFTDPNHAIILLLLHSSTDWSTLKNDLAGNTYPEAAAAGSMRGELFRNRSDYGMEEVTIANNCVHLSAGPFEALFEIDNFLGGAGAVDFDILSSNLARRMVHQGFSSEDIGRAISNPTATIEGQEQDLFSATEEKNTSQGISSYGDFFQAGAG